MFNDIHSGGVDRTGLVVAMETALLKMEIVEPVNPLEIVRSMRDKRGMMLPAVVSIQLLYCTVIRLIWWLLGLVVGRDVYN